MRRTEFKDGVHCVEYALMHLTEEDEKAFEKQFNVLEDFKNAFIKFMKSKIWKLREEDEEFDKAMTTVLTRRKTEGKVVDKDEFSKMLKEAYKVIGDKIKEVKLLNSYDRAKEFRKNLDKIYYIWLPDDVRSYAIDNVMSGFDKFFFGKGKNVRPKEYGHTLAMQSRPLHATNKKTGEINEKESGNTSLKIIFKDGIPKLDFWDMTEKSMVSCLDYYNKYNSLSVEEKEKFKFRTPDHKRKIFDIYYNEKNDLQKYLLTEPNVGSVKLLRYWKKGKWRYRVQINFSCTSPIVESIENKNHKVAVDFGTETKAVVRDDGYQVILGLTNDFPRVTDEIRELDRYLSNSRIATNPEMFNDDGTTISRKEALEKGLQWHYSNRYKKALARRRELYRLLREKRKLQNLEDAKKIFELGNEFYTENNSFSAWGTKRCRMADKTVKKYAGNGRGSDYTKQIHDRAVGTTSARLEHLCNQKELNCYKVSGKTDHKCSTYNHFTDKDDDIFEKLSDRLIVFDTSTVGDEYLDKTSGFDETFDKVKVGKRYYVLQRDLYSAAKMLYYKPYTIKVTDKKGKEVEEVRYKFDKEGFNKFFEEKFYPEHEKYLMKLRREVDLSKISGTIFGGI